MKSFHSANIQKTPFRNKFPSFFWFLFTWTFKGLPNMEYITRSLCLPKADLLWYFYAYEIIYCGLGSRIWDRGWYGEHFWPTWRLLEAKHHTASAHFGTLTQCLVHPTVPKCVVAVWCLASNSLHGGQKKYAHVKTPRTLNKFNEVKFCMVWPWWS